MLGIYFFVFWVLIYGFRRIYLGIGLLLIIVYGVVGALYSKNDLAFRFVVFNVIYMECDIEFFFWLLDG